MRIVHLVILRHSDGISTKKPVALVSGEEEGVGVFCNLDGSAFDPFAWVAQVSGVRVRQFTDAHEAEESGEEHCTEQEIVVGWSGLVE